MNSRFCQPIRQFIQYVKVEPICIVESGCVDNDNISTTTIWMDAAICTDLLRAGFKIVADFSNSFAHDCVDKLQIGLVYHFRDVQRPLPSFSLYQKDL